MKLVFRSRWPISLALMLFTAGKLVPADNISSRLDTIASAARAARQLPALGVAVQSGDRLLLAKGYGEADLENHVPATANTVYKIGSITRAFTAACLLKLVSQGKLRLDDRVADRLPMYSSKAAQGVTLRHLLTNTSGIPNYSDLIGSRDRAVDLTPQEVVARFADKPLEFAPGNGWKASSSNWFLLGLVIEQVAGITYGEYVERELRTAGIRNTVYCDTRKLIERRARGYARGERSIEKCPTH